MSDKKRGVVVDPARGDGGPGTEQPPPPTPPPSLLPS